MVPPDSLAVPVENPAVVSAAVAVLVSAGVSLSRSVLVLVLGLVLMLAGALLSGDPVVISFVLGFGGALVFWA